MISLYGLRGPDGVQNLMGRVVPRQFRIQACAVNNFFHLYPEFLDTVPPHIAGGEMVCIEDVSRGPRAAPELLRG